MDRIMMGYARGELTERAIELGFDGKRIVLLADGEVQSSDRLSLYTYGNLTIPKDKNHIGKSRATWWVTETSYWQRERIDEILTCAKDLYYAFDKINRWIAAPGMYKNRVVPFHPETLSVVNEPFVARISRDLWDLLKAVINDNCPDKEKLDRERAANLWEQIDKIDREVEYYKQKREAAAACEARYKETRKSFVDQLPKQYRKQRPEKIRIEDTDDGDDDYSYEE